MAALQDLWPGNKGVLAMDLEMKVPAEAHRLLLEGDFSNPIAAAVAFQMSLEIHVEAVHDLG